MQQRGLTDTALAVEQRQRGGQQVGDHKLAFDVPAKEEGGIPFLVVVKALVGGAGSFGRWDRRRVHRPADTGGSSASAASSAGTYCSSGMS